MQIRVSSKYDEMSRAAATFVGEYIKQHPSALLCLTSGDTPTGIFKYIVEDAKTGKLNFEACTFVGLDEWAGLDGSIPGSCRHYMDQHLFIPLGIDPAKIQFFDGTAPDLQQECDRINEFIEERGSIDLMMVGLGLNGHVGLNEPGVNMDLYAHLSDLEAGTKETAKKYFKEEVALAGGITLGPRHLLEARVSIIIAAGSKKAAILAKALEGMVSNEVPASIIQQHPDAYIFIDRDAAVFLSPGNRNDER